MKKIIVSLLIVLFIWIAGYIPKDIFVQEVEAETENRFIKIDTRQRLDADNSVFRFYDKETGVQYLFVDGYKCGGLTVLVNADGSPLIYKGE